MVIDEDRISELENIYEEFIQSAVQYRNKNMENVRKQLREMTFRRRNSNIHLIGVQGGMERLRTNEVEDIFETMAENFP